MMTLTRSTSALMVAALVFAAFLLVIPFASAQTTGNINTENDDFGSTPILYDQDGDVLNENGGAMDAGWYYNSSGQSIYYYGNGTWYNPTLGLYGGANSAPVVTPGVPATGAGGGALMTWLTLAIAGIAAAVGVTYLARQTA